MAKAWVVPVALPMVAAMGLAQPLRETRPQFEVASIKSGPPPEIGRGPVMRGGPGTPEPNRIYYSSVSLMNLLTKAYRVYPDQVIGPEWLISELYTVTANVPPGATKDEFDVMLQNLLTDRFKLAMRRDEKEFPVYALTVEGGEPKLKRSAAVSGNQSADDAAPRNLQPDRAAVDGDGCPVLSPGAHGVMGRMGPAGNCSAFGRFSMADLADALQMIVAMETGTYYGPQASPAHIIDRTGLKGEFDFKLKFRFAPGPPGSPMPGTSPDTGGPNIFTALEKQLGLKLEKVKAKLPVIVIERAQKKPAEN
jgi:uncharacterized protein (TIGR03435 family)